MKLIISLYQRSNLENALTINSINLFMKNETLFHPIRISYNSVSVMAKRDTSESKISPEKLLHAVDHVLHEYCRIELHLTYVTHSNEKLVIGKCERQTSMKLDKIALHELSFNLWERALITSLGAITNNYFPHYQIVQQFVNYALNARFVDFGLLTNLLSKLLYLHPPNTTKMQEYYWSILNDKYIMFKENETEEESVFWCLIKTILWCLKNGKTLEGFEEKFLEKENESNYRNTLNFLIDLHKKTLKKDLSLNENEVVYFDSLSPSDKFLRVLVLLKYLSDVLESDFLYRKSVNQLTLPKNSRSFLSRLFWENASETGTINKNVRKLICAYKLAQKTNWCENLIIQKLLSLLAEEIRIKDATANPVYPFVGDYSMALADKITSKLFQSSGKKFKNVNMQPLKELKPHWLRLLVCSSFLSRTAGKSCFPDLRTVCNILNFVALAKNGETQPIDYKSQEIMDLKNYETSFASENKGRKVKYDAEKCNSFCKLVNLGKVKRIKSFRQFNLNDINDKGWAPLHEAVLSGHEECVEALINYRPKEKDKWVDTRIKGIHNLTPLMCAVIKEHHKICQLLLHHSGPSLLEDVNDDNETPMDLCRSDKIARLLKNHSEAKIKFDKCEVFDFDISDFEIVIELCIEMTLSYFITHRTWDVLRHIKREFPGEPLLERIAIGKPDGIRWDYSRYQQDFDSNLYSLKTSVLKVLKEKYLNQKTLNSLKDLLGILMFQNL